MARKPLAVVILAAGKGTRMNSALPKVMHPLAGRPMINWLLDTVKTLSPQKTIIVTGPDMPALEAAVKPHSCAPQKQRKGTADAVKCALPLLKNFKGDVLVLLGDTPLITAETLKNLIKARGAGGLAVLGTQLADPKGYGRLVQNDDQSLEKIIEEKDASPKQRLITLVNAGAFCIDGTRLENWLKKIGKKNAAGEYYLTDLPEIAAKSGAATHVYIAPDAAEVQGCNDRADLAALEKTLQQRLRKNFMQRGISMQDPDTVYLHFDTKIAADVVIEPSVFFGAGVTIESGAHIKAFSHLEGAHVKAGATIGPFARLRPGTQIGEDARIGNFVEIKKSTIGKGSKVSHLAYVGDCVMGADTNFGCGAITVNYDGFNKFKTTIGKGVMVGSNVNLVAPVHVHDGAFIAAGSTITADVPEDALAIARAATETREGRASKLRALKNTAKRKKA